MKKLVGLILLVLCLTANSQDVTAAGTAGLTYEVYRGTGPQPSLSPLAYPTVVKTGVSPFISYSGAWGGTSTVLDSGYWDRFIVRWYGYINVPTTGTYTFGATADDGVIVRVNNTEIISGWYDSGGALRTGTPVTLTAGTPVPVEIWYYENGGGQAISFYYLNNGSWTLVPSTWMATDSSYFAAVAPTPVYSSGITTVQQARKTTAQSTYTNGHAAVVDIQGSDNEVTIQQIGGKGHFVNVSVSGNVNSVDILQTSTDTVSKHYMEATVVGGNNNLILQQRDTSKTQFINVDGNYNSVTTNQKGSGNHYLDLKVIGNNHTAGIVQDGAGSHKATVELSGTQPWNFNLNQNSSTSQTYSLPHNMTNGTTTSGACYTVGGCNLTINQQ